MFQQLHVYDRSWKGLSAQMTGLRSTEQVYSDHMGRRGFPLFYVCMYVHILICVK
jgi:hypothetical protein